MAARGRTPKVSDAVEGEVIDVPTVEVVEEDVADHTIGKIKVKMRKPSDAQIALLGRLAVAAEREPEKYFSRLVDTFFRIIEGLLVNREQDILAIESAIIDDKLTIEDIVSSLGTKDQDAAAPTRVRTRRAR